MSLVVDDSIDVDRVVLAAQFMYQGAHCQVAELNVDLRVTAAHIRHLPNVNRISCDVVTNAMKSSCSELLNLPNIYYCLTIVDLVTALLFRHL